MAKFFGDDIEAGDRLLDLLDGPINVVSVHAGYMRCTIGGNQNTLRTYGFDGILRGRRKVRTLYWHNPIVMDPRKSQVAYLAQVQAVKTVTDMMGNIAVAKEALVPQIEPEKVEQVGTDLEEFLKAEGVT